MTVDIGKVGLALLGGYFGVQGLLQVVEFAQEPPLVPTTSAPLASGKQAIKDPLLKALNSQVEEFNATQLGKLAGQLTTQQLDIWSAKSMNKAAIQKTLPAALVSSDDKFTDTAFSECSFNTLSLQVPNDLSLHNVSKEALKSFKTYKLQPNGKYEVLDDKMSTFAATCVVAKRYTSTGQMIQDAFRGNLSSDLTSTLHQASKNNGGGKESEGAYLITLTTAYVNPAMFGLAKPDQTAPTATNGHKSAQEQRAETIMMTASTSAVAITNNGSITILDDKGRKIVSDNGSVSRTWKATTANQTDFRTLHL